MYIHCFKLTKILGISAFYHDSAAALLDEGEIIAAVQEERFTRKKHDASFPHNSIQYILDNNKILLEDIDHVVFYDKPFLKFERLIETYVAKSPLGLNSFRISLPIWLREKLFQKNVITNELKTIDKRFKQDKLFFSEHHYSHAASAFYPSPFSNAIVLTIDGVGEWATTTVSVGKENNLEILEEIHFPHSIGLLYSAFTYYIGFKVNSGEYKVMGLAPYGNPKYKDLILDNIVDLKEDGSFRLDQSYFNYTAGLTMVSKKFVNLFGQPVRLPESMNLTQFHMDIAASIQLAIEEIILKISKYLNKKYSIPNLCLAGGVALNCVANSKILSQGNFKKVWIQPASGDAGGSLGAALAFWHKELNKPRKINLNDSMKGSYLGPSFNANEIEKELNKVGADFIKLDEKSIIELTAKELSNGKAIGWFQGRMEFGPRALGSRSIIADPRSETMQKTLNLKVKYRESFRPFAPSILYEDLEEWFDLNCPSPYMLLVANISEKKSIKMTQKEKELFGIDKLNIKRSEIPAVTHIDYSARIQTVHQDTNIRYYKLISEFKKITNCPILVNTSFNVRGEPIVSSPIDAFKCFMGTELDCLVIEDFFLYKEKQKKSLRENYKEKYDLD